MNLGILGAGKIARTMSRTVAGIENVTLKAVASRDSERAKTFADEFSVPVYYGSYEELAKDESLDLIYIATPHSRHYEDCILCIENGRNVICEKPFTANAKQAEKVFKLAEEKGVFITEAMWTRFLPMRFTLDEIVKSGVIGEISSLTANLGYAIADIERLKKPELAGGALLDLGVYTINFAFMVFGTEVMDIKSTCTKNEYGVDMHNSLLMTFKDGKTAVLHSNMNSNTGNLGVVYGSKGKIEFYNINNCEGIKVFLNDGTVTEYKTPPQITGYEYEIIASFKAISEGRTECLEMPHSETMRVLKIMDELRGEWGIRYPFE